MIGPRRRIARVDSRDGRQPLPRLWFRLGALLVVMLFPAAAQAHGPIAPVASSYEARITHVPLGVEAKVVDADQSMWLRTKRASEVIVLDYRGVPYLRITPRGSWVNVRSEMYFLNANPVEAVPSWLTAKTAPRWQHLDAASEQTWHDGRLHALTTVALRPGVRDVGAWRIPLDVDGKPEAISGRLLYEPDPSLLWFWPVLVVIACVLAAWRVRRATLDLRVGRALAIVALGAVAIVGVGRGLYGRPSVSAPQLVELGLLLAFVAIGLWRLALARAGYFTLLVVSMVALYEDLVGFPVLLHGYVLMALPPDLARAAVTTCIGATVTLVPLSMRIGDRARPDPADDAQVEEIDEGWT
jgi:hypothetical protein